MLDLVDNIELFWAKRLIFETDQSFFLTGNAGTGKSTFLKYVAEECPKNKVVLAPTGVAAINAKGTTIHSFFNLPFTPFNPTQAYIQDGDEIGQHQLLARLRYSSDKRALLRELELMIIDEISMVRADVLDAIDLIMKHFRRDNSRPFGGVQVMFVGDLYQLPPIAEHNTWEILRRFYPSTFFYHSIVMQKHPIIKISLSKIYRQHETEFIDILNAIRHNRLTPVMRQALNQKLGVNLNQHQVITLCTHRNAADNINERELNNLPGKKYEYQAIIKGDFRDNSYPVDERLVLKEKSQIMFVKNDISPIRKYYNGKLGTIEKLEEDKIWVRIDNNGITEIVEVIRDVWTQYEYEFDLAQNKVFEKAVGTFTQFPIQLAWAITVHKSQGLTFEHVYLDVRDSFVSGQTYVALSRCTTLDGISLKTEFPNRNLDYPDHLVQYSQSLTPLYEIQNIVSIESKHYLEREVMRAFDFSSLKQLVSDVEDLLLAVKEKIHDNESITRKVHNIGQLASELFKINETYRKQLKGIFNQSDSKNFESILSERLQKATEYYSQKWGENVLRPMLEIQEDIRLYHGIAAMRKEYDKLVELSKSLYARFEKLNSLPISFEYHAKQWLAQYVPEPKDNAAKKSVTKVSTHQKTLDLLKQGMSVDEIAKVRNLVPSTIFGHLIVNFEKGLISADQVLPADEIKQLEDFIDNLPPNYDYAYLKENHPEVNYTKLKFVRSLRAPKNNEMINKHTLEQTNSDDL